jgi:hypothetical protein
MQIAAGTFNFTEEFPTYRLRKRLVLPWRARSCSDVFDANGAPIRRLREPYARWQRTLQSLSIRYRKPYAARHSSVSWNLMMGRNPLWVAKQHGHSILTMLTVYAAWTEGALEADVTTIRRAMRGPGCDRATARPTRRLPRHPNSRRASRRIARFMASSESARSR